MELSTFTDIQEDSLGYLFLYCFSSSSSNECEMNKKPPAKSVVMIQYNFPVIYKSKNFYYNVGTKSMDKLSNKAKLCILFISIGVTSICLITLLLHHDNKTSCIQVDSKDIISTYKSKYSQLDLYKQNDKLIINAYSNSKFDEPNQLIIPFKGEITKDDILVKWKTIGGMTVDEDSDSIIVVNVIIKKDGKTICNENISLCEKGWEIFNDYIGK